jgi:endonuclease III
LNNAKRKSIFEIFQQKNSKPETELIYSSNFELLISVILSAQATDVSVNKATVELFKVANTPEALLNIGTNRLKKYIKTIGLYNTKAENIIKTCRLLVDKFNSEVPSDRADLESLPGVGRKTANVILNTAFGMPTIAVDTHIFRVSNRIGIAPGKNVLEVEKKLLKLVPEEYKMDAHHWLILHGRYTCTARQPNCSTCIIYKFCDWNKKQLYQQN